MWFYFLIFFIICFFCFFDFRQKNPVYLGLVIMLVLVAGLCGPISKDHNLYVNAYHEVLNGRLKISDISFRLICFAVNYIFHKPVFLFLIYAALGVGLKATAIKRLSEFWFFSILIYFSLYFFLHELTQIRAGVASAFILLSIPSIHERNLKKFLLYAGCAIVFHFSALIILPFYFLKGDKVQLWYIFLIPIGYFLYFLDANVASLVRIIDIDIVNLRFAAYKSITGIQRINVFNVLMLARCLLCGLLFWRWKLLKEKNQYSVLLIKFYFFSCFIFIAFADIPVVAFRVSELLATVEIILVPMIIYLFNIKVIGKLIVAIIGFLFLVSLLYHQKLVLGYF
jgi:hypothetical protein